MQQTSGAYNVGIRLVCNADDSVKGTVTTTETKSTAHTAVKKDLIIYYSWSGNTRGVAKEIARQTGFDSIELELVKPYSTDYNTVLNEAQRDQHKQARPALKTKIEQKKMGGIRHNHHRLPELVGKHSYADCNAARKL